MNWLRSISVAALLAGLGGGVDGQPPERKPAPSQASDEGESWYQSVPVVKLTPQMIIQQKAQARAVQRIARMESMKWYGMSASRPRASTTPFMGVPSPRWQMPGGRPFAWTPYRTTSVYIVR